MRRSISMREFVALYEAEENYQALEEALEKYFQIDSKNKPSDTELKNSYHLFKEVLSCINENEDIDGIFLNTKILGLPDFDFLCFNQENIVSIAYKSANDDSNPKYQKKDSSELKEDAKEAFKKQDQILKVISQKEDYPSNYYHILMIDNGKEGIELFEYTFENGLVSETEIEIEIEIERLVKLLNPFDLFMNEPYKNNPLFEIDNTDFLISPVDDNFIFNNALYALTPEQIAFKNRVLSQDQNRNIFFLTGGPGTGKTLVAYDLLRELNKRHEKTLYVFAGRLRDNFEKQNFDYVEFKEIKEFLSLDISSYSYLIIDEAQRLNIGQQEKVKKLYEEKKTKIILAYDVKQPLNKEETSTWVDTWKNTLKDDFGSEKNQLVDTLNKNLRNNINIQLFIATLFRCPQPSYDENDINLFKHIEVRYFSSAREASHWIKDLTQKKYTFLYPGYRKSNDKASAYPFNEICSKSKRAKESHTVLGGEEDKVVTYLDEHFEMKDERLTADGSKENYSLLDETYVNLSRARKKLAIAIVNNLDLYKKIIKMIDDIHTTK